jgi:hypothetical protein
MKIFLHIGMPKTGSTSIQRTLLLNKGRLAKAGVHYPYRTNALYGLVTGTDPGPPLAVPKRCHTLIISDERLFNRVRSPEHAEMIASALRKISTDIKLISYVRREDEVFVSAYFTRLLMGSSQKLQDLPLHPVQTFTRLSSWNEPFGVENMIVRRFGQSYLPDGLIADFARTVGIDHLPIEQAPVANSSPRSDVLEIIRLLNEAQDELEVDRHSLKVVARTVGFGDPVGLSAEDRTTLIDNAAEQNRQLSGCYFGGEQVFDHPVLDNAPAWPTIGVGELGRVAEKMAQMHGIQIGAPPADLDEALNWIRDIAERCAGPQKPAKQTRGKKAGIATAETPGGERKLKTRSAKAARKKDRPKQDLVDNPNYLVFHEDRELLKGPRTILCTGLGRSGTSAIASLLEFLGLWLGVPESSRNRENKDLIRAFEESTDAAKTLIADYDERFPIWGFKAPGARTELDDWLPLFRNPLLIVPHRDVVGRLGRQSVSGGRQATFDNLRRAIIHQRRLIEALEPVTIPQLHISFSLLSDAPEEALAIIADFTGLAIPEGDVRAFMHESRERYLAEPVKETG